MSINFAKLRNLKKTNWSKLTEIVQRTKLRKELETGKLLWQKPVSSLIKKNSLTVNQYKTVVDAGLITFLLHCEARIASSLGQGFYTIGPCGEESLSAVALSLRPNDASALHYRHVATSISRQLQSGRSVNEIVLDRARGFTCSTLDPVTGGKHCSIGGSSHDFIVTSTLSSQAPPAVGRAIAIAISHNLVKNSKGILKKDMLNFPSDAVSYVSVGDGSVNNGHFLSAINLAKYAQHRKIKCPVVFGISDNGTCISLPGYGWLDSFVANSGMKHFAADGNDVNDVHSKTQEAIKYSRSTSRPTMLVFKSLPRRFGHAATDRQFAYLTDSEINRVVEHDPLSGICSDAIADGVYTSEELLERFDSIQKSIENAFDIAVEEPKITSRDDLIATNSKPLVHSDNKISNISIVRYLTNMGKNNKEKKSKNNGIADVMRKHMTKYYDEVLENQKDVIYIGEDVQHGGYYLVTDGLCNKYPGRVLDFPPDETTLVGAGMGLSQSGLVPIVEMPYAKYLDCASDIFKEAIITNWLTNGKQSIGMIVRLQGFDKGVFGGNYHTHNSLNIPPGLDVICHSNGLDYVRAMRYAMCQARGGRIIMSVDSTDLLNRRHLMDDGTKDDLMLSYYPQDLNDEMTFDDVVVYKNKNIDDNNNNKKKLAIISYGNGVPTSLLAMKSLDMDNIIVIDCPYLSSPPLQLQNMIQSGEIGAVLFADVCKEGFGMPLGGMAITMQNNGVLAQPWLAIGATNTYNPLSRTLTFLTTEDVINSAQKLLQKLNSNI
jgi:2-oxoisovalerate dehydrogenase E1 component